MKSIFEYGQGVKGRLLYTDVVFFVYSNLATQAAFSVFHCG